MSVKQKASPSRLGEYRRKRVFDQTPEPEAEPDAGAEPQPGPEAEPGPEVSTEADGDAGVEEARFVVHEHHARSLHWDLRL